MDKFIQDIAKEAGLAILKKFGKVGVKYTKTNPTDVVTEADLLGNKIITDAIKKKFPNHGIISEESPAYQTDSEYCWIIDPLDGTGNFVSRVPLFAVMIGLARNGVMELGVIYDPYNEELVFAKRGHGTFLNGKRVHASEHKEWKHSWGISSSRLTSKTIPILKKLVKHAETESFRLGTIGSIAISTIYLLGGRRDWMFSINGGVWDYAAPYLAFTEAGYIATECDGTKWSLEKPGLMVANKYLYKTFLKILDIKQK